MLAPRVFYAVYLLGCYMVLDVSSMGLFLFNFFHDDRTRNRLYLFVLRLVFLFLIFIDQVGVYMGVSISYAFRSSCPQGTWYVVCRCGGVCVCVCIYIILFSLFRHLCVVSLNRYHPWFGVGVSYRDVSIHYLLFFPCPFFAIVV